MKSLGRLTAEQAALEDNFVGTFEDCLAHVKSIGQGAGYAKYWKDWDNTNRRWVGKCQSWVVRNCIAPKVAPATCPTVDAPVTPAPAPVTPPFTRGGALDDAQECIVERVGEACPQF